MRYSRKNLYFLRLSIGSSFSGSLKCSILRSCLDRSLLINRIKIGVAKVCYLLQYIWYSGFFTTPITRQTPKYNHILSSLVFFQRRKRLRCFPTTRAWIAGFIYSNICIFICKIHNIFNKFICNKCF